MIRVVGDEQRLINLNPLVVYFMLSENEHSTYNDDIKQLNRYVGFSRDIFKFEPLVQGNLDNAPLPESIREELSVSNTFVRLIDAPDGSFFYAFAHINVDDDQQSVEESIIDMVVEVCKENVKILEMHREHHEKIGTPTSSQIRINLETTIEIFNRSINKSRFKRGIWGGRELFSSTKVFNEDVCLCESIFTNELPLRKASRRISDPALRTYDFIKEQFGEDNMQKILSELLSSFNTLPDFDESKAVAEGIVNDKYSDNVKAEHNGRFEPKHKPSLKISVKRVTTKMYNKDSQKYGVEIEVNGKPTTIYFKSKDQTMLYLATLLRHKVGHPLYNHELYHNSRDTKSRYRREKSRPWFKKLYNIIYRYPTKTYEEWIDGVDKNHGRPLHQGKSRVVSHLKAALNDNQDAIYYCVPRALKDSNQDSYYTVKCSPNEIIVDQEMQKLCSEFERLYE